ncbi:neuromedin-U receptor 1 [Chanos chanos]|uniref:Neuromedin-U receptor 1 n=1 Tax=Chanos chanos TaxID=29144 RepID=A0A6J2VCR6_CHACN|nr:neuromedin-U receptor 1-like [Chanos chanos]
MLQFNCSSPDSLYSILDTTCCLRSEGCKFTNEDKANLCLSHSAYLEEYLGPRRSPLFLPICITYLLIFIVGAFGNVLTCVVIFHYRVMRTPTNYYLFSLAVSDLLVLLLGLPLELYELWSNYPFLLGAMGCYFKTCLFETVCLASVLNVTALSAERYIAVVHPLRARHLITSAHAKRVILVLWAVALLCALPNTSLHGIRTLKPYECNLPESAICHLVKPTWMYNLLVQVTALLFFLFPMLIISVFYLLIGLQLHKERKALKGSAEGEATTFGSGQVEFRRPGCKQKSRHRQINKMLCVLVIVFGICWAPFHIDRVMYSYIEDWTGDHHRAFEYVHLVSGVLFYLSSVVNPILYNLMSTRFREMFREVTCRRGHHRRSVTQVTLRSSEKAPTPTGATEETCTFSERSYRSGILRTRSLSG